MRLHCRSKLTGSSGASLGWSRSCDQLFDHHVFAPKPSSETAVGEMNLNSSNFPAGQGRCWAAVQEMCD
jgi:hypothetical protein